MHNIEVSDEETKQLIIRALARANILLRKQAGPTPKSRVSGFLVVSVSNAGRTTVKGANHRLAPFTLDTWDFTEN